MNEVTLFFIAREASAILAGHVGRENAIPREELRKKILARLPAKFNCPSSHALDITWHHLPDRRFRRAIAEHTPWVCSCSTGYFLPRTAEEKKAAILYHIMKIRGERKRIEAISRAYPELEAYVQMELEMEARP